MHADISADFCRITYVLKSVLQVRVNLWDLAGSPDYVEVRNEFYKDSQAALLVRDAGAWSNLCMVRSSSAHMPAAAEHSLELHSTRQWLC
jgi:GTPase SAR1 family protein